MPSGTIKNYTKRDNEKQHTLTIYLSDNKQLFTMYVLFITNINDYESGFFLFFFVWKQQKHFIKYYSSLSFIAYIGHWILKHIFKINM